jgi:hypothetical protein
MYSHKLCIIMCQSFYTVFVRYANIYLENEVVHFYSLCIIIEYLYRTHLVIAYCTMHVVL